MTRAFGYAIGLLLALAVAPLSASAAEPLRFGRFGTLEILPGDASPAQVVIVLSGEDGYDARATALAQALAAHDSFVIGVDTRAYLRAIAGGAGACAYPAGELEGLSQYVQKTLARPHYSVPILVGIGAGGALAKATIEQAPPDTFHAAFAVARVPGAPPTATFCATHRPVSTPAPIWQDVSGDTPAAADQALVARVGELNAQRPAPAPLRDSDISDLPIVDVAASGPPSDFFAVVLSGDGGWASLDREVGGALAARGIPVLGFNSLQYFWTPRSPEESSAALARILDHGLHEFPERRIVLVGFSRGADVMTFMVSRLPATLRAHIALVVLMGPALTAEFEFHVSDWLGASSPSPGLPIAPEVAKLGGLRVLCMYGRDEPESVCRTLPPALATRDERPGGHHFDGDYDAIGRRIAQELAR